MSTHCPTSAAPPVAASPTKPRLTQPRPLAVPGSSHYAAPQRSRWTVTLAVLFSATFHAALLFTHPAPVKKKVTHATEDTVTVAFVLPDIKELEEPEPEPQENNPTEGAEALAPVPMQVDLPRPTQLSDFVQELDYSSFIDRGPINRDQMWVIPESRRGGKIGKDIGNIVNLSDLDRAPEPVFQPPPVYPGNMRRDAMDGKVIVEFIVDTKGHVLNAFVVDTSNPGFNVAAITGVERWTFRAGIRGGKKVNTRMRVPLLFNIIDANE